MKFNDRLKSLRKENNMTQESLANKLSYGSSTISNYESGHNQPSIPDLIKIANIFDVSLDYLMGIVDVRTPAVSFVDKETASIMELLTTFDESQKKEALMMLQYIEYRETHLVYTNKKSKSPYLKVAQPQTEYTL